MLETVVVSLRMSAEEGRERRMSAQGEALALRLQEVGSESL